MEPIGSVQGLASGIDFRELVDAIIQAEAQPVLRLSERKSELDRRTTAWGDVELRVRSAFDRSQELADPDFFKTYNANVIGGEGPLTVTAGTSAVPGSFSVEVLQLATHERVGSDLFTDRTAALGLSGEFVIGGQAVQMSATDSLDDLVQSINQAAARADGGGVSATVVGTSQSGYRMVLTAADSGAAGIQLADGAAGVLQALGVTDGTTSIKHQTSDGAKSDGFVSATADIATLLGLTTPPAAGAVTIGALTVTLDLSTDSLDDIAAAINTEAAGAGSLITAQVVVEEDESGASVRRLDIGGTTAFTDVNGILETLGVVEASRSSVAQQVTGAGLTDGDASTPATGATRLTNLWAGGSSAAVQAGDTLTLSGTHGDGTTFQKTVVIGAGDTYQDLVNELNSGADGFGVGTRTATAAIVDGALVVTDDVGGGSRLALSIVSHNEGGGALDFGDFGVTTAGRAREITAGRDAEILVDGAFYARSSNSVTDIVEGVTMSLTDVSASGPVTVEVARDDEAIVDGIEAFVQSFNAVSEFVLSQFTGIGAEEGEADRPLAGDRVVRQVRNSMRTALQSAFSANVTAFANLAELGIEAKVDGTYEIDRQELLAAVRTDPLSVERIFSASGTGSVSSLAFVSAGSDVEAGDYEVFITTPAAQAGVTGTGFGGTYVDDGVPDTLTITDASSQSAYDVALTNGMTLAQIVDALNTELGTATTRQLQAGNTLASDAVGTDATVATLLQDLHDPIGTNVGVADGDTFTISGTRDDGSTFFSEWTVSSAATQTLGTLQSEIASAIGSDVVVEVVDGVLTATAVEEGTKSFTLSVSSDNAGGGTFGLGGMAVTEVGRAAAAMTASDVGGQLSISHDAFGSVEGFTVAYTAGGTDGTASLGVAAATYNGADVAGTIGGHLATGIGLLLTGDEGTAVEDLAIEYAGADSGSVGSITFSRGIASLMETLTDGYLDGGEASIQGIVERLDTQKRGIDTRIERFEERLELREATLIRQFTALEEALALAQGEMAWMQAQLGSLIQPPTT